LDEGGIFEVGIVSQTFVQKDVLLIYAAPDNFSGAAVFLQSGFTASAADCLAAIEIFWRQAAGD
jgi:hypothetical protein